MLFQKIFNNIHYKFFPFSILITAIIYTPGLSNAKTKITPKFRTKKNKKRLSNAKIMNQKRGKNVQNEINLNIDENARTQGRATRREMKRLRNQNHTEWSRANQHGMHGHVQAVCQGPKA